MTIPAGLNAACISNRLLAYDDFSEANGTNIVGKALDVGATWGTYRAGGSLTCQTGKLSVNGGSVVITTEVNTSSVILSLDSIVVGAFASNYLGLCYGHNGATWGSATDSSLYLHLIRGTGLTLTSKVNNVSTVLFTNSSYSSLATGPYALTLKVIGTTAFFTANGIAYSATCPAQQYTKHGIICAATNNSFADNFKVEAL